MSLVPPSAVGRHVLADLYECPPAVLLQPAWIAEALQQAAKAAGASVISAHFHHFGVGQGVTGVLLLMESHISIHTWPEHGYAALDIFMCGQAQVDAALRVLQSQFQAQRSEIQNIQRGVGMLV